MNLKQQSILVISLLLCAWITKAQERMTFSGACQQGNHIVVAAMGDLILHRPLQEKAQYKGFTSIWSEAIPYIQAADIAYANLEGPIAPGINRQGKSVDEPYMWDFQIYSDFPTFNYHPSLAKNLKDSGFTIVSTANNHTLDRSHLGIRKTIETLNNAGLAHVGTRLNDAESFITQTQSKGVKIAWLACTEHTNGMTDTQNKVLYCNKEKDSAYILKSIRELKGKVDAVIIAPHWGVEYQHQPNQTQKAMAKQWLEAGATAILGSHPHVLQPVEKYITKDGRETLISYSLGNFVSFQGSTRTRTTMILLLGLTKTPNGTIINGVRFVPMFMRNRTGMPNIHLSLLEQGHTGWLPPYQIITRMIPLGNALFKPVLITNPQCH